MENKLFIRMAKFINKRYNKADLIFKSKMLNKLIEVEKMKDEDGYYWIDEDGKKHREDEEND